MVSRDHESERPAGSNAPREKKRGSQESQPRLGTRRQYLAARFRHRVKRHRHFSALNGEKKAGERQVKRQVHCTQQEIRRAREVCRAQY